MCIIEFEYKKNPEVGKKMVWHRIAASIRIGMDQRQCFFSNEETELISVF